MLPDTKLPKMVMCIENPYQCFQRVYKCSCHLRAFRATADVANNGKSVIASKVAIFGNFMECQNWKENLALHKGCQKRQKFLGKVAIFGNF